ncbi:hypothetical protein BGZ50_004541 [Haplosporangium sp. Z 11]|nr:hypothetical protein BGZ50_004541 [Haplosporangium sp. Z 11]
MVMVSSQHHYRLARTLVPLALLAAGVQSACVSLAGSTACPGFKDFQVDTGLIDRYNTMGIKFNAFKTLAEFDAAVLSATPFQSSPTCNNLTTTGNVRYQNTMMCSLAVLDEGSVRCKGGIPGMCLTTCASYESSLRAKVGTACPNDAAAKTNLETLTRICSGTDATFWGGLQDTTATCFSGPVNEPTNCGLGSKDAMCAFCATNATDTCCSAATATCAPATTTSSIASTSATSSATPTPSNNDNNDSSKTGFGNLSTAALGGIIGGGVALLLILFAFIVCCIRRSKNKDNAGKNGSKNLARHMSNSSASKYKISSPKIQEEGFAGAMAPSAPIPMTALPPISITSEPAAAAVVAAAAANRASNGSNIAGGAPGGANGKQSYCQALYPYQASMADELDLTPGDIVNVQRVFDDGWAVGVNMNTSNEGAFPVVCVMFVDESALDDDFEDVNMHSMTPMSHREDEGAKGSPRSSMPSRASSPVHLPRRHSSMIRDSAILPGLSNLNTNSNSTLSPMTSSPLAGGKPPVRDTMMSDASSINRWWDGEGVKQQ